MHFLSNIYSTPNKNIGFDWIYNSNFHSKIENRAKFTSRGRPAFKIIPLYDINVFHKIGSGSFEFTHSVKSTGKNFNATFELERKNELANEEDYKNP